MRCLHNEMSFRDLSLRVTLDTSSADLITDFFIPLLSQSVKYDRGVGFFSSGWIARAAEGMTSFARNSGKARWITSPILSAKDFEALKTGEEARRNPLLHDVLKRNLDVLERDLRSDTLSALAWMIADCILEFRLALPRGRLDGEFHDKFGVFTDGEGNRVSFNGSYNDSIQGLRNYESLKVFVSWRSEYANLVDSDNNRFERLWCGQDPNVQVFEIPEAIHERIIRLRTEERPYPMPRMLHIGAESMLSLPKTLALRDYQDEAINAWFDGGKRGFLEMATGAGKTITALAASVRLFEREKRLAVIVTCPFQHLVDQWDEEGKEFGYRSILAYQNKNDWIDDLNHKVMEFNAGDQRFISVITTHATFCSDDFQATIARLEGPTLLVADEAHHLGAEESRLRLPLRVHFRLALSATPNRWFDEEGTAFLREYFGETVYSFPLDKAIGTCLTLYYYYPHLVELTDEELLRYGKLSSQIAKLVNRKDEKSQDHLKMLLIRRAELLNKAVNKLACLSQLIDEEADLKHTLFYCAPEQIDKVSQLLGLEKGLMVSQFTNRESMNKRRELLAGFAEGRWQALVAMHCLDEGVDVPSTRAAYILASSGNPREFIQRRGRILRRAEGKAHATIHDLIAAPPRASSADFADATFASERSIVRHELARFKEFAGLALNKHQALDVIWDLASHYGLLDF